MVSLNNFWKILVVDDDEDVHHVTRMALKRFEFENKGIKIYSAYSAIEGKELIATHSDAAAVLLDVVMESDHAGLDLAKSIREELNNPWIRIILRTGQPGMAPELSVIEQYDINDYKLKVELTRHKLITTIISTLRNYRDIVKLEQSRQQLKIQNKALELASKIAQSENEAKTRFLAVMSHEMRTPLNAVIGISDLLYDTNLDLEQKYYTDIIFSNSEILLKLINNILDLSKISSQEIELENIPFDLYSLIEETIELMFQQANEKNLDLSFYIDSSVPQTVVGDSIRLRQILINLISNAIKFTEVGKVNVLVTLLISEDYDSENYILFQVKDSGIGIEPEKMNKLFNNFSQLDQSITRRYGGTGLGLAICKQLVEKMDGEIWVYSNNHEYGRSNKITKLDFSSIPNESIFDSPHKGSTFYFTFKAKLPPDFEMNLPQALPQFPDKKVLILEEEVVNRCHLVQLVTQLGINYEAFSAWEDALALIKKTNNIDLIIINHKLAGVKEIELLNDIKNAQNQINLQIVLLIKPEEIKNYKQFIEKNKLAGLIQKPIRRARFYKTVTNMLSFKHQETEIVKIKEKEKNNETTSAKKSLKILIAEDNKVNQKVAILMLKNIGYDADIVENGINCISALENKHYDIILMDVEMPDLDGINTTKIIRKKFLLNIYIIGLTGYAMENDKKNCLESGMNLCLSKPIQKQELIDALNQAQIYISNLSQ